MEGAEQGIRPVAMSTRPGMSVRRPPIRSISAAETPSDIGDAERNRQEGQTDLDRVVVQDLLQVQRAEEEHPEHPGHHQHLDEVGARHGRRAKHAQRHQRIGHAGLAGDEPGQQGDGEGAEADRVQRAPRVAARLDDRVDGEHQRTDEQDRAGHVRAVMQADALIGGNAAPRQHGGEDPDREVDEEDPVPAEALGEDAAGQQSDGPARRGDEAVDADRLRPIPRLGTSSRSSRGSRPRSSRRRCPGRSARPRGPPGCRRRRTAARPR